MSDLIGQTFGRFRIVEQLGSGGMANVYKAIDTRLDRAVALKIIRTENLGESNFLERFEREAKALARLNHPNIVHINDFGELDGLPYLEMDYVPGGTLEKLLGVLIPWSEAARFLAPVAYALDHAHRQGIIHRDVKPSNILIMNSGEPMITDFGIAKIMEPDRATLVTLPGFGVGTPAYMSPEQVMGKEIDGRSDVYSLGIVLYEMFTGHPPFRADTAMAVAVKQVHDPVPRPRRDLIPLPAQAEQAVMTALAKLPNERFSDMAAFAETLDKMGKKAPVTLSKATFTAIPIPKGLELDDGESNEKPPSSKKLLPFLPSFSQNRTLTLILALLIVVVISTLVVGVGYAQRLISEQRLISQSSDAAIAPPGENSIKPLILDNATETGVAAPTSAAAIPVVIPVEGTPTVTLSPTATQRGGIVATIQSAGTGNPAGSPTLGYPTTPPTLMPTAQPTSIPTVAPTSPPATVVPPTSPPPSVAPTSPPPSTPVATQVPQPTRTPKPANTHKPPKNTP